MIRTAPSPIKVYDLTECEAVGTNIAETIERYDGEQNNISLPVGKYDTDVSLDSGMAQSGTDSEVYADNGDEMRFLQLIFILLFVGLVLPGCQGQSEEESVAGCLESSLADWCATKERYDAQACSDFETLKTLRLAAKRGFVTSFFCNSENGDEYFVLRTYSGNESPDDALYFDAATGNLKAVAMFNDYPAFCEKTVSDAWSGIIVGMCTNEVDVQVDDDCYPWKHVDDGWQWTETQCTDMQI